MHNKSAITHLSLVLMMGALIILVPFTSINFPNVKAQEYGDILYSQYPTDDKKYECRTGPFEGFFVSSVEFCKHVKFDDRDDRKDISRDNRTGTQGPPGLRSTRSQVHQELMGHTGAPGVNGTKLTRTSRQYKRYMSNWDLNYDYN